MVPLYTPVTESEVAVISSLLEAYGIPFFIRGGGFGKLYPGMQINHYNTQTFLVPESQLDIARVLIADFMTPSITLQDIRKSSVSEKLRVVFEALVYGWFVPGKKHHDEK